MSTPLLVVLRILSVLRVPLGALPADKVPGDLLMLVELGGTGWGATSATLEPGLVELVERYRSLKPVERSHFTNTAVALANAIVSVRSARRHHH